MRLVDPAERLSFGSSIQLEAEETPQVSDDRNCLDRPSAEPKPRLGPATRRVGLRPFRELLGTLLGVVLIGPAALAGTSTFVRSDCNADGGVNVADAVFTLDYLFSSGTSPLCLDACDVSDDGSIDIGDAVSALSFLFSSGAAPAMPYPDCGTDPTPDALDCASTAGSCPPEGSPPSITSTAPATAVEGEPYTYDVEADDPDVGDALTFSIETGPASASIDPDSGLLEWTPDFDDRGDVDFIVRVTDSTGLFDEQPFTVTVEDVNLPPMITSTPPATAVPGQTFTYPAEATDPDAGDTIAWSLESEPPTAAVDPTTGVVTWTPSAADAGTMVDFTLRATDLGGLFDEQVFSVAVGVAFTPLHRINCGGVAYTDSAGNDWSADFGFDTGGTLSTAAPIAGTDDPTLFRSERYDLAGPPDLTYSLPIADPGIVLVRLYFAEIWSTGISGPGQRQFDVTIEGTLALDNFDPWGVSGGIFTAAIVETPVAVTDGNLTIRFTSVVQNAKVSAIEVLGVSDTAATLAAAPTARHLGSASTGSTTAYRTVTLSAPVIPPATTSAITVDDIAISGPFGFQSPPLPFEVAPGGTAAFEVRFEPSDPGFRAGSVTVTHTGVNSPTTIDLTGNGFDGSATIGFIPGSLPGAGVGNPTTLQFGPDGRLYVGQQNGVIRIYTIDRTGPGDYTILATETLNHIRDIANHNDDGTPNPAISTRQLVGMYVAGTAENPVIYASSSDPRIAVANPDPPALSLDTNSGIITRLTWNGTAWQRLDLVRGLPRSEENHGSNDLILDETTNTLYLAQGGNTNLGAPSTNLSYLSEYALSAAILTIDLDAIGETTYDLPTLDDEDRPDVDDANDPFGGNDGKNQARLVPGGPVQIHAPGFRNPYDVVLTTQGRLYTVDNGANGGWGDTPIDCLNDFRDGGATEPDGLHFIDATGYYAGHPNPTRGDQTNTFNPTNPQSPVPVANPIECDHLVPGPENGSLVTFGSSTNGICEYTASNFGGALLGNLLTASLDGNVYRLALNASGTQLAEPPDAIFTQFGLEPLDVTAQGDDDDFPGTVWVAVYGSDTIVVFEPTDYDGTIVTCTGDDDPALDEDGDGYSNADEIANGTNPCSAASFPPDFDGDFISDLLDPDDDDDGEPDTTDIFAIDPADGTATALPLLYSWNNGDPNPGGLLDLGFTGLMTNGQDYASLFDPSAIVAGGAAGVVTVSQVTPGTAEGAANSQEYGLQFGIPLTATSSPVRIHTRVLAPFATVALVDNESFGLFLGTGTQDDYIKLVVDSIGGIGGIEVGIEESGVYSGTEFMQPVLGASTVDLYLQVNPVAGTVQPQVAIDLGPIEDLGPPLPLPAAWLTPGAIAVGIISTTAGAPSYAATWDFFEVTLP